MNGSRVLVVAVLVAAFAGALAWDRMHRPARAPAERPPAGDRLLLLAVGGGRAPRLPARRIDPAPSPRHNPPAPRRGPVAPERARTYSVKPGDSLSGIARRILGDAGRWREIADLNGITSPDQIRPGQSLRLP